MAKFEASDGFIVKGWMRTHLGLSGGEMLAYAIVYQYSQKGGAGVYIGGVPYMSQFIGCTENTARTYLHNLTSRGLIIRKDATQKGIPFQHYYANPERIPNIAFEGKDTPKKFEGTPQKFEGRDTPKKFEGESNIENNKKKTIIPTLSEVLAYSAEREALGKPHIDAEDFINHYAANGWKQKGGNIIVDWKAAFRTWESFRIKEQKNTKTTTHRSIEWKEIR